MSVSVIIPAFNSSTTISQTLESLISQTYTNWEAIVIDDGSDDNTSEIVRSFQTKCSKIKLIIQHNHGEAAARNKGLQYVNSKWVLFLDSDDWIESDHLEKLTEFLDENLVHDAVVCKAVRVTEEGTTYVDDFFPTQNDLFPYLAKHPVFPIHTCLIKSSIVKEMDGFDESLKTCPDWDLWQRIARKGFSFGLFPKVLSYYCIRPKSASNNGEQLLKDGLRVIETGHRSDPRVSNPSYKYKNGLGNSSSKHQKFYHLCWCAGLLLGSETDPSILIEYLKDELPCEDLNRYELAKAIYYSTTLPLAVHPSQWIMVWVLIESNLASFLENLERESHAWGFSRHSKDYLIRIILERSSYKTPVCIGHKVGISLNITQSIDDIFIDKDYKELFLKLTIDDYILGSLELPVFDGIVTSQIIKDSISSEFSWIILRKYYENNIYKELNFTEHEWGVNVEKNGKVLYESISLDTDNKIKDFHNQYGWGFFIKEIFNYSVDHSKELTISGIVNMKSLNNNQVVVDIINRLADISTSKENAKFKVVITIGGVCLGFFHQYSQDGYLKAEDIYNNILDKLGYELCRVAVREGLIGRKFNKSYSLMSEIIKKVFQTPQIGKSRKIEYKLPEDSFNTDDNVCFYQDKIENDKKHKMLMQIKTNNPWENYSTKKNIAVSRHDYEMLYKNMGNSFSSESGYQIEKLNKIMDLISGKKTEKVLEISIGEFQLSKKLSKLGVNLTCAYFSSEAADNAKKKLSELTNIKCEFLDAYNLQQQGKYDLIILNEILFCFNDQEKLEDLINFLRSSLVSGGFILIVNTKVPSDTINILNSEWKIVYGFDYISDRLKSSKMVIHLNEVESKFYKIDFYKYSWQKIVLKHIIKTNYDKADVPLNYQGTLLAQDLSNIDKIFPYLNLNLRETRNLPILMYHSIFPEIPADIQRYTVDPQKFKMQIEYLYKSGFYTVDFEDWYLAKLYKTALPGRAVIITFDDGYTDFSEYAWPILKKYDLKPYVFLVADNIGRVNNWDDNNLSGKPLLNWEQIKTLKGEGVKFGSHSLTHKALTALTPEEIVREAIVSKAIIEKGLGTPVNVFSYPKGDENRIARYLVDKCDYLFAVSTRIDHANFDDPLHYLPRIEVTGDDDLEGFVSKLIYTN